jgi:hypothetical protein
MFASFLGYPTDDYWNACKRQFLATTRAAFDAQMVEFKDHHMVSVKKVCVRGRVCRFAIGCWGAAALCH